MLNLQQTERQQNLAPTTQSQTAGARGNATAFPKPIHALVGTQAVRLAAFGDIPGHSPAYLCIDDQGDSTWVSMSQVQIVDSEYRPQLVQELLNQQFTGERSINNQQRQQ